MTEKQEIAAAIIGFIVAGNTEKDIKEWISIKHPSAKVDEEWDSAVKELREAHKRAIPRAAAFIEEGMREMYRRLADIGDYASAAKVLKDLDKINQKYR